MDFAGLEAAIRGIEDETQPWNTGAYRTDLRTLAERQSNPGKPHTTAFFQRQGLRCSH